MPKVATSVNGLNPAGADPPYNGEQRTVRFGDQMVQLRWIAAANSGDGGWYEAGPGRDLVQLGGTFGMQSAGTGFNGTAWDYLKLPIGGNAIMSFSWAPQVIYNANLMWAAGLRIQEKIVHTIFANNINDAFEAGIVYYSFADGDLISPLISVDDTTPGRNLGQPVASQATTRRFRGGWVKAPIDAPTAIIAPHIYVRSVGTGAPISNCLIQQFDARYRLFGIPT